MVGIALYYHTVATCLTCDAPDKGIGEIMAVVRENMVAASAHLSDQPLSFMKGII